MLAVEEIRPPSLRIRQGVAMLVGPRVIEEGAGLRAPHGAGGPCNVVAGALGVGPDADRPVVT